MLTKENEEMEKEILRLTKGGTTMAAAAATKKAPVGGIKVLKFDQKAKTEMASLQEILSEGQLPAASALPALQVPLRVIAGRADRVAPVDRVVPYYDLAGSAEKDYILAGRANGFASDYGHLDLVLGDHAAEEIYPRIVEWFSDRW